MRLKLTEKAKIVIWQIGNAAFMCNDKNITDDDYERISLDAINDLVNDVDESASTCDLQSVSNLLIARESPIRFARWILKYAKDDFDENNSLCHKYEGKHYTTTELYEIYRVSGY